MKTSGKTKILPNKLPIPFPADRNALIEYATAEPDGFISAGYAPVPSKQPQWPKKKKPVEKKPTRTLTRK
jgi:hypothetical protein